MDETPSENLNPEPETPEQIIEKLTKENDVLKKEVRLLREHNTQLEEQLQIANTDDLIEGFYKRRYFFELVDREITEARRLIETGYPFKGLAILYIDFDHFGQANNTHGHSFGDKVLKATGGAIKKALRKSDTMAKEDESTNGDRNLTGRPGGDELMVCLFDTDAEGAMIAAERVRKEVQETIIERPNGQNWTQTVSIGVAMLKPGLTAQEVIDQADTAAYESKHAGRNRVTLTQD